MHSILERERAYRRRLAASLALAVALQLLAWWLLPSPLGRPVGLHPGIRGGTGGRLSLYEVAFPRAEPASRGSPAAASRQPNSPAVTPPEVVTPTPDAEPEVTSETITMGPPAPSASPSASEAEPTDSGTAGSGDVEAADAGAGSPGDGAAAIGDGQPLLHNQLWVHPQMPERVLVKRKIDDFVLLQVLVGADGRVHDVRTLRGIPNCEECNRSAVEAAWRLTFDPPVVPTDSSGVWSQIFNYRFSYRR